MTQNDIEINEDFTGIKYYETVVLDFGLVQFIDEIGVKCLKQILTEYNNENVRLLLTNCNGIFSDLYY